MIYEYLSKPKEEGKYHYVMVGYIMENTLTENGHVARGVCKIDENGHLVEIHERTRIEKRGSETAYTEDDGASWVTIPEGSIASMNMWGFTPDYFDYGVRGFSKFLSEKINVPKSPADT